MEHITPVTLNVVRLSHRKAVSKRKTHPPTLFAWTVFHGFEKSGETSKSSNTPKVDLVLRMTSEHACQLWKFLLLEVNQWLSLDFF
ncbi:hypothetical protein Y1Q_0007955 [Alligator mississippiensis]|uniref:Uncharacterized protein n=1 Tax=Alligator mississippiensis TaxID=8496 RepID=A0A151NEZ2_ALLMI|nr:hypothetical protein Y1Q_0007955 [Alligator mississippiensis]